MNYWSGTPTGRCRRSSVRHWTRLCRLPTSRSSCRRLSKPRASLKSMHGPVSTARLFRVAADHEQMSRLAADSISEAVRARPDLLLGVATGSTPTRTYQLLTDIGRAAPPHFDRLRLLKLDEWGGLDMDDPATCEVYFHQHLVRPLNVSPDRYAAWNSRPTNP